MQSEDNTTINIIKSQLINLIAAKARPDGVFKSQAKISQELSISQGQVSQIFRGRVENFSVDFLLRILFKLGYDVDADYAPSCNDTPLILSLRLHKP